jgi:hypothetical protein
VTYLSLLHVINDLDGYVADNRREMKFKRRNSEALADLICGNAGSDTPTFGSDPKYFPYRSSMYTTEFFRDMDMDYEHDGSTRHRWVADVIDAMLNEPHEGPAHPPEVFCRLIDHLMSPADATNEGADRERIREQVQDRLVLSIHVLNQIFDSPTVARVGSPNSASLRFATSPRRRWSAAASRALMSW